MGMSVNDDEVWLDCLDRARQINPVSPTDEVIASANLIYASLPSQRRTTTNGCGPREVSPQ